MNTCAELMCLIVQAQNKKGAERQNRNRNPYLWLDLRCNVGLHIQEINVFRKYV